MIDRIRRVTGAVAAAAVLTFTAVGIPSAAHAQQSEGSTSAQAGAQEFSDAKLDAYVDAVVQVSQLVQKWQPKIQTAQQQQDKEKARSLQKEANAELVKAIQDAKGISLKEYKEISLAARQDKELYNQLNTMVQERRNGE
ncbi:DUF4168 domain-containing protein [Ferruginivarius sediminum]|uniref:DUF4168 domain-containing protein n=1 Tax=Ferruginivarius sediminum TaxID=2661937 RepID=A0A369TGB0_9PROT|nr:DUF4168 domain-containing protein [Ferruginivarius sediminum]RDD63852.1 DUF4168 domain-containing protein [Ferruginivarius sediminum]